MYGRSTGHHCADIAFLCIFGGTLSDLAMDTQESDLGDSGAPWYHGSTAYGVHGGRLLIGNSWFDYWSAFAYLEDALDVTIMTS